MNAEDRQRLADELSEFGQSLFERAQKQRDRVQAIAGGVVMVLAGAIAAGLQEELSEIVADFAQKKIASETAANN